MSERYRGNSPNHAKRVVTPEAQEAQDKASRAFQKRNSKQQSTYEKYGYHIVIAAFLVLVVIALANSLLAKSNNPESIPVIEEDEIALHNSRNIGYTLGPNDHFNQWMLSDAKNTFNVQMSSRQNVNRCITKQNGEIIPDSYNFRETYPQCAQEIASQGNCSASYGFATASTISDRICQQKGKTVQLSPQPLISCNKEFSYGCKGGYISTAFDYAKKTGLPETNCIEYSQNDNEEICSKLSSCKLHKIHEQCVTSDEENIKREIMENGPVIAVMPVYRDFLVYKSGVYRILPGVVNYKSGQAVKIIGWGRENEQSYWVVENSWGASWGENGTARVALGQDLYLDNQAISPVISAPEAKITMSEPKIVSSTATIEGTEEVGIDVSAAAAGQQQ